MGNYMSSDSNENKNNFANKESASLAEIAEKFAENGIGCKESRHC